MIMLGCSEDKSSPTAPEQPVSDTDADCIGCHTNQDMLMSTAIEDTLPPPSSGEG